MFLLAKRINILLFVMFSFCFNSFLTGQSLISNPESVAFDTLNNRYLVSCFGNSTIVEIDSVGTQSVYKSNIGCLGNCIHENVLYVSSGKDVIGFDLSTDDKVFEVNIKEAGELDGITADSDGNLYVIDMKNDKIYKISIANKLFSVFSDKEIGNDPQDIIYDKFNNRIVFCYWSENSPVEAINLDDSTHYVLTETATGFFDGITIDNEGNFYLSSHFGEDGIYLLEKNSEHPPVLISTGYNLPAGLEYNIHKNLLAIPNFKGNRIDFLNLPAIYLNGEFSTSQITGNAPLKVNFQNLSTGFPAITKYEWDFDSDGTIDSYDVNPSYIYGNPGSYSVTLKVSSDSLTKTTTVENLINVFDGNSSVNFFEAGSYGLIPATEQLVLGKEWSILCWVNLTSLNRKTIIDKKMLSIETSSTSLGGNVKNGLIIKLSRNDNTTLKIKGNANSLTTNRWHHIAISYSIAQQEFLCFVNGIQQTLSVNDSTIMATEIAENINSPIIIGNRALLTQHLLGAIDELQIWNKALSQNEISSLIDNPPSGSEDNLSGYWKMNEGNGIIFYDIASNNNGELINGAYCCGYDPNDVTTVNHPREKVSVHNLTFSIEQNYPNPFNPSTNINFTIPSSGNVKIILFNVLGEKVFDLMEQNLSAGKHSYMFSEKTLSSGVYFYSIVYGGKAITKKMILLR